MANSGADSALIEARKKLEAAEQNRQNKNLDRAETLCIELIRSHPTYVGALQTLGLVLADKQKYEAAANYLNRAATLNPKDWKILTALSGVYLRIGASEMAALTLEQARRLKPDEASILVTLGEIYREEREYELAADAHEKAFTLEPSLSSARIGFGHACAYLGRLSEAAAAYEHLIAEGSRSISTLFALSQLPPSLINVDLESLLSEATSGPKLAKEEFDSLLVFARSQSLDKAKRYAEAYQHLVAGNRAFFKTTEAIYRKDAETRAKVLDFVRRSPARAPFADETREHPISLFILGPSRSGKTTMERLAAQLPGVKRGFENPIIENAVRRTFQGSGLITRERLLELGPGLDPRFREHYLEDLAARAGSAKVFTNTHPGRIFDVYRMASAVPNTRFIFIKRNLDDLVLRIYMKKYQSGHHYSYDLAAAREYVNWYHDMMDEFTKKFPSIIRVVKYEEMIASPAAALHVASDLCNLPEYRGEMPALGDDRGASAPYRQLMNEAQTGSA